MTLLDNDYGYAETASKELKQCKPDPEEMVATLMKEQGFYVEAKEHIFALSGLPIRLQTVLLDNRYNPMLHLLGDIENQIFRIGMEIEKWKAEIDK